ncbi:MAG: BrnT family toxin [Nitrospirales bacterium]
MFAWDIRKAIANYEKHGVPFGEAATVFGDTNGLEGEDFTHSRQERRFKRIGR